jgi:hypothetical protein
MIALMRMSGVLLLEPFQARSLTTLQIRATTEAKTQLSLLLPIVLVDENWVITREDVALSEVYCCQLADSEPWMIPTSNTSPLQRRVRQPLQNNASWGMSYGNPAATKGSTQDPTMNAAKHQIPEQFRHNPNRNHMNTHISSPSLGIKLLIAALSLLRLMAFKHVTAASNYIVQPGRVARVLQARVPRPGAISSTPITV